MSVGVRARNDGDHHGIEPAKQLRLLNDLETNRALASKLCVCVCVCVAVSIAGM